MVRGRRKNLPLSFFYLNMKAIVEQGAECQACGGALRHYKTFFDARLRTGQWAWVCKACKSQHGWGGTGVGVAQEYDSKTDEKVRG